MKYKMLQFDKRSNSFVLFSIHMYARSFTRYAVAVAPLTLFYFLLYIHIHIYACFLEDIFYFYSH